MMPNKSRRNNQARHKQVASAGKETLARRRQFEAKGGSFRKAKGKRG